MSSWGCLPPPLGNIHVYDHNIQTASSLKPLGQSKPNFMWSIIKRRKKVGESNLADKRLLTALRFDPNTDPLSSFQQMGP